MKFGVCQSINCNNPLKRKRQKFCSKKCYTKNQSPIMKEAMSNPLTKIKHSIASKKVSKEMWQREGYKERLSQKQKEAWSKDFDRKNKARIRFNEANNPNWKGGVKRTYNERARRIMEKKIGRKLTSKETVHHLDHNWKNNHPDNLFLFPTRGKHVQYHFYLKNLVKELLN